MAIERKKQKIFAGGFDSANGNIAKYGSKKAGALAYSFDLDEIQTSAWLQGMIGGTPTDKAPYLQDLNAIFYTFSKQLAYIFQAGIPEWNSETEYFANISYVSYSGEIYIATQDNTNEQPSANSSYWQTLKSFCIGTYSNTKTYNKGDVITYIDSKNKVHRLISLVDNNVAPTEQNIYKTRYIVEQYVSPNVQGTAIPNLTFALLVPGFTYKSGNYYVLESSASGTIFRDNTSNIFYTPSEGGIVTLSSLGYNWVLDEREPGVTSHFYNGSYEVKVYDDGRVFESRTVSFSSSGASEISMGVTIPFAEIRNFKLNAFPSSLYIQSTTTGLEMFPYIRWYHYGSMALVVGVKSLDGNTPANGKVTFEIEGKLTI